MTSQLAYRRGDVVYADMPLVTGPGSKRRPAVIVSSNEYNDGRDEVIASGATRAVDDTSLGNYVLADWQTAGLRQRSAVTGWPVAISKEKVLRRYGRVSERDMAAIDHSLILIFGLGPALGLHPDLLGLDS